MIQSRRDSTPRVGSDQVNQTSTRVSLSQEGLDPNLTSATPVINLSIPDLPTSGWATSREDPRLRIHYQFHRDLPGGGQIFMTIMDALATASTHLLKVELEGPFTATGMNQVAETHLEIEPSGAAGTSFTWGQLVQALVVFWEQGIFVYYEGRDARDGTCWNNC